MELPRDENRRCFGMHRLRRISLVNHSPLSHPEFTTINKEKKKKELP